MIKKKVGNMNKIRIRLDIDKIKKFARVVTSISSDVNIIKGSCVYDAKSIMAIFALGTLDDVYVEIISDDEAIIENFKQLMKEFE